jgi:neutral ceramidase
LDAGSGAQHVEAGSPTRSPCVDNTSFLVGSGMYDITGPAAEVGMMGYGQLDQATAGIHIRLRSRAFVIASPCNDKRVVLVTADLLSIAQAVKQQVVARLRSLYGDLYRDENVLLSATHTHSGPGGYSHYALYSLTTLGFSSQNFDAVVDGIVQSIVRADKNLAPGNIHIADGDLLNTSINASPEAYQQNPPAERGLTPYDTNKQMTQIRLTQEHNHEIGLINWFAVHPTSMGNDNHLISGDNKGYAAYRFEKTRGADYRSSSQFVAAFAQKDEGDANGNIFGGTNGGGKDDFESTQISGEKQFQKAVELYEKTDELLRGPIDFRAQYLKWDSLSVDGSYTGDGQRSTCSAAIGVSMLAGSEDGPGFGSESISCEGASLFWKGLSCNTYKTDCQLEKPIVFEMGSQKPYPWTPEVMPVQIVRLGSLALIGLPFEVTTMAGRRLSQTIHARLKSVGVTRVFVVGLSNAYAGYLTTREEYRVQNYEGASNHFGPWTLAATQQKSADLAEAMARDELTAPGPTPRDLRNEQSEMQLGVVLDSAPVGKTFGDVIENVKSSYAPGSTVRVSFWGGNPRNNLHTQDTLLAVEKQVNGAWKTVATDGDWETRFFWEEDLCVPTFACSRIKIEWTIPQNVEKGTYRIRYFGDQKDLTSTIHPFVGESKKFVVGP